VANLPTAKPTEENPLMPLAGPKKRQSELKITLQQRAQKFHTVQNRKVTGKKQQLACLRKPKKYPTNTSGTEIPSHMHSSASIVLNGT